VVAIAKVSVRLSVRHTLRHY